MRSTLGGLATDVCLGAVDIVPVGLHVCPRLVHHHVRGLAGSELLELGELVIDLRQD